MPETLPRKALIAVSSYNGAIYPGGHKTGVFFVEALHPYEVLTAAGFMVGCGKAPSHLETRQ